MKSKKIQILTLFVSGMVLMSCNASGTLNTPLGSVSANGTLQTQSFTGSFQAVENVSTNATGSATVDVKENTTSNPSASPSSSPTSTPSATPTSNPSTNPSTSPSPSSSPSSDTTNNTTNNTTNITNITTIINVNYTNISSEVIQTTIEADDGSSPTVIVLPNGQINNYTVNLNQEQANLIKSGKAVIKVKTKNHPNGEIKCKLNKK
jgi:hypothetical protein